MNPNTWFNEISSKLSDTMISMMATYIYQKGEQPGDKFVYSSIQNFKNGMHR